MTQMHPSHSKGPLDIMVGMSGGVDSSVAALLLQQQGHNIRGLFMKNWEEDDEKGYCSATVDLEDAAAVAKQLGIELLTRNFSSEYWDNVFQDFLVEYRRGRTPNPDVICNKEIKFKVFLNHALELGSEYIATGHYARIESRNGFYHLLKARDKDKDQSYFLYTLQQQQLSKTVFPLGELHKSDVRLQAKRVHFDNFSKKDSTGICFIGERKFKAFLGQYLPIQPGDIRTLEGQYLGKHQGLMYYTIGQRQGLGIGGHQGYGEDPWYVADKRLADNTLLVVQGHDNPLLFSQELTAKNLHWVTQTPGPVPFSCTAKTRYRQQDQMCTIESLARDQCVVQFEQPQRAITPGQSVVVYRGDECLGGGIIDTCINNRTS